MILHTSHIPCPATKLLDHLRSITVQPYRPLSCGYTYSHELRDLPDFRLIEGVAVPPHSDGIAAYRPILMLHNPSNNYVIRNEHQALEPQRKGTMIILDIDSPHEVWGIDPLGGHGPWSGVVWEPGGQPCLKSKWDIEQVAETSRSKFLALCTTIQQETNATLDT